MAEKYQAIMFDLDGTLLPMDMDEFTKGYFGYLYSTTAAPLGYAKETFVPAMWKGVSAMVKNDGTRKNSEAFWETFEAITGIPSKDKAKKFDEFYKGDFNKAKAFTQPTPLAVKAVEAAREKAEAVALATNPLFPRVAVESRVTWTGISPAAFDYITDYDNSTSCKPNPAYYLEIAKKLNLDPARCLMIGNNAQEDIEAASEAGFDTYLVTDCLINERETLPDCKKGSLADCVEYLKSL
ncbi:MAG: HAD family hydrolase [Clostridia bacterium]|nr:HAD family hydrolase [Clostridia bacterium]